MSHVRLSRCPLPLRLCALLMAAGLLASCESIPAPGETVIAQVLEVPRDRAELRGAHSHLYAALRVGVVRADAEHGRLALGRCAEPDERARGGVRVHVATTVLPVGTPATRGAVVEVALAQLSPGGPTQRHGVFVASVPTPEPAHVVRPAAGGSTRPLCRPPGLPQGRWRIELSGPVSAWEIDFARAELARREQFGDDELADGRVVLAGCQLKVVDGSDWNRPTWLARAQAGLSLRVGDVVRLRSGASEMDKTSEPLAEVLGPAPGVTAPSGVSVVRCH